jgi:hypothetical protein
MEPELILLFGGPFVLSIAVIWLAVFALKRSKLSRSLQKIIFVFLGTFLIFPVLIVPHGAFLVIPAQNITLLVAALLASDFRVLADTYGNLWAPTLISLTVTAIIFTLISLWLFRKKALPKQAEKPI